MPASAPPAAYRGTPCRRALAAGTVLYRVHRRPWSVEEFSPVVADAHFGGGRFDCADGDVPPYTYLYAAFEEHTAVAEVLLRGLEFNERGSRILPRAALTGRRMSGFETGRELTLLALTTATELAAVAQDEWLVQAGPSEYGQTRRWGRWLREQAPWADGMVWPSKRDLGREALILFGDRCLPGDLKPAGPPPLDLDDDEGWRWLSRELADYRVSVRRPTRPPWPQ